MSLDSEVMVDEAPKDDKLKDLADFLDTDKNADLPILIHAVEEVESTALESVFDELFKRLIVKN